MPDRVVICGAGVIGSAVAYYLAKRGVAATIIESDAVAAGASGAAAGILTPPLPNESNSPLFELQRRGYDMHLDLAEVLPDESGIDYRYQSTPRAMVAVTEEEEVHARRVAEALTAAGFQRSWLTPQELLDMSGWVSASNARGAVLLEPSGHVDAYRYSLALLTAAERMGANLRSGEVRGLEVEDGRVVGVNVGNQIVEADAVVVAMGPWSVDASNWLGLPIPVEPLKGQIVKVRPAEPIKQFSFGHRGNYAILKEPDVLFLGTTEERVGFDRSTTTKARDKILEFGIAFASVLKDAEFIEQTACLRPLSADNLPIIGSIPGIEGAYLGTGHGRQGILQSPPSGKALAELIVDGSTETLELAAFDPERFGKRVSSV